MVDVFFTSALVIGGLMVSTWIISGLVSNASLVDLVWGVGFVLVVGAVFIRHSPGSGNSPVVVALTSIWGLRLSGYLVWRNLGKGEDFRYRAMRTKHGPRFFWISLGTVFVLQGGIMWVVSLPVQATVAEPGLGWGPLSLVGIALWVVGVFFETVGDFQLARFKAQPDNKDRVMDKGLWSLTRHPNYFGDFCVWWGLYLIAVEAGHWWSIIGPALMTALLMKYSGASLLEETIVDRRPAYRDYIRTTSAFFPMAPKS